MYDKMCWVSLNYHISFVVLSITQVSKAANTYKPSQVNSIAIQSNKSTKKSVQLKLGQYTTKKFQEQTKKGYYLILCSHKVSYLCFSAIKCLILCPHVKNLVHKLHSLVVNEVISCLGLLLTATLDCFNTIYCAV